MPNDNATLKSLIAEAVDACRVKIITLDETDPRIVEVAKNLEKTFAKFQLENLYAQPIPYDEPQLLHHILLIRTSADGSVEDFVAEAKKLIALLENIVKEPILWVTETGASAWNNQMLDALKKLRSTVTRKKKALANAGSDPMNASGFPALDEEFNTRIDTYRARLKDNSIQANGDDIKVGGDLERLINMAPNTTRFIQYFKMAIKFIREKTVA